MYFPAELKESLTYKFSRAANEMKAQGKEIISLGLGEPDFQTPEYLVSAVAKAMNDGFTHYSASQGLAELRSLIAERASKEYGVEYHMNEIVITPGIKAAIYFALASILKANDRVINITPCYVSYPALIKFAEPKAEIVNIPVNTDYTLDIDAIKSSFNKKTACILLNTPHNPTGMLLSKYEVEEIIKLCIENNAYIVSDEVYEKLVYEAFTHISFGCYGDIKENLIITNGYSKSYAMTGWRLGYAIAPKEIIFRMNLMQQHINTNTCTFIQKAACSIYENEDRHIKPYVRELEERANYFHKSISSFSVMKSIKPKAGFFCFADISATGMDSNTFCVKLLEETGIASTPGIAFGSDWDSYVRFSIAVPMNVLKRAVGLMKSFVESL
jgi:aspartate aminotransferase